MAMQGDGDDTLAMSLRRMGLQPERVEGEEAGTSARIASPRFRLTFGAVSVIAGRAEGDVLEMADPDHPSTSLLASSLPRDWRENGQCWIFVPECGEASESSAGKPAQMREFFKMVVLLIDLFDASHIFWSPARLWSDAQQFRASVAEMLASGMPPVLHLVAFRRHETGDGASIGTRGLALFAGQELEARIPVGWTVAEMVRRLSRLALDMMLNGPIRHNRTMRGLGPSEWIGLSPQATSGGMRSTVVVEFGSDG
ncbi:hypothetical protein [Sphingopyxis sp.]|uniref:hypothetical protein n=1 Tax=Sphingopyxis sp. TaxID=1908224 RepID=UPI002ED87BF8